MQDDLSKFREQLDDVSPSFCAAKWLQVTLHLHSGHNHSCHHPKPHKTPLEELKFNPSALHNTCFKKEQRLKMKSGFRPAECDYCWNIEDLGPNYFSDRTFKSKEYWAAPYLEELAQLPANANVNPTYVEVSFSNVCNFRCSYCTGNFSSRWSDELKRHGPYPTRAGQQTMKIFNEEDNPYIKAFWDWWPDLVPSLKVFRITGGEPLLSRNTFRVLEDLKLNPRPNLEIAVNSNLGISDSIFRKFLELVKDLTANKKIKSFTLFTSAEAWGEKAEYIRNGLEFPRFQRNLETFIREVPDATASIMSTFNALSLSTFLDLARYVKKMKESYLREDGRCPLFIDMSYLRQPSYQTVQVLPKSYLSYMEEIYHYMRDNAFSPTNLTGFHFSEVSKAERLLEWMRQDLHPETLRQRRKEFYQFFAEHDRRRNTDFLKTFPEMEDFWTACQKSV